MMISGRGNEQVMEVVSMLTCVLKGNDIHYFVYLLYNNFFLGTNINTQKLLMQLDTNSKYLEKKTKGNTSSI